MDRRTHVDAAKKMLLQKTAAKEWCTGVGIERQGADFGLVLSVEPGAGARAQRFLRTQDLGVPVRVRELGPIRARRPARQEQPVPGRSIADLRAAAQRRSSTN